MNARRQAAWAVAPDLVPTPRWIIRAGVTSAAFVAILPIVTALGAWRDGWMPTSDWASIVIRAHDTFSAHPPLIGIYSSATVSAGSARNVYHPGPLQEWLLSAPIHLFAPSTLGILLGSALLVSISITTVLIVAWRRGGWRMLCLGSVGVAGYLLATGPAMVYEPLHTPLASFAMLALLASAWSILDDDPWFWPVAVFFLSLAGQAQVAFAVPGAIVMIVVATLRTVGWFRGHRSRTPRRFSATSRRRHSIVVVTAIVTGVCWAAPVYDQLFSTGNLWALFVTSGEGEAVGPLWALRDLARTLAVPPSWVSHSLHLSVTVTSDSDVVWHTNALVWVTAAVVLGIFLWALRRAIIGERRSLVALGTIATAALIGCFVAASLMPDEAFSLLGHREFWRSAGFFTWGFLVVTVAEVAVTRLRSLRLVRRPTRRVVERSVGVATAVLVVVSGALLVSRSSPARQSGSIWFGSVEVFTAATEPLCNRGAVVVHPNSLLGAPTALGMIALLTMRGCSVHAENLDAILPGPLHRSTGEEPTTVRVGGSTTAPQGCRQIASYDPADPPARYREFSRSTRGRLQPGGPLYLFECPRRPVS